MGWLILVPISLTTSLVSSHFPPHHHRCYKSVEVVLTSTSRNSNRNGSELKPHTFWRLYFYQSRQKSFKPTAFRITVKSYIKRAYCVVLGRNSLFCFCHSHTTDQHLSLSDFPRILYNLDCLPFTISPNPSYILDSLNSELCSKNNVSFWITVSL